MVQAHSPTLNEMPKETQTKIKEELATPVKNAEGKIDQHVVATSATLEELPEAQRSIIKAELNATTVNVPVGSIFAFGLVAFGFFAWGQ